MSSPAWQDRARSALEATPAGPDRLHRAWVTARRHCMSLCEEPSAALWARGAYAVDPGPDPFDHRGGTLAPGLCAALGALGAGALAGALLKPAGAPILGSALGALSGPWVWNRSRRSWVLFCLVCGFSLSWSLFKGGVLFLPLALVFALFGWLAPRRLSGQGAFDLGRAQWALQVALKAEEAMILARLAQESNCKNPFSDLQSALADLAAARGEDRLLAADALVQQAQAAGLVRSQEGKTFVWNEGSAARYQAFGAAFEGDLMMEERAPWYDADGRLVKGLARRAGQ